MKRTVIVSAKIIGSYAELIRRGVKRYEIRSDPFCDAEAIRYIDASDGSELGLYTIVESFPVDRSEEQRLIQLSSISVQEFQNLFPPVSQGGQPTLWVAKLGGATTLTELLKGSSS
ncbi:MAG: hypothetical protein LKI21_07620 [Bifidobacterium crudilactis]|jgi:hypothetical protein|nr:hypothetical protein [Bifidobacterium crudilactis]